jgi:glycylpeptide N-tetradecanoyltransferase
MVEEEKKASELISQLDSVSLDAADGTINIPSTALITQQ